MMINDDKWSNENQVTYLPAHIVDNRSSKITPLRIVVNVVNVSFKQQGKMSLNNA